MIDILIDIIREKGRSSGGQEATVPVLVCERRVPGKIAWEREFTGEGDGHLNMMRFTPSEFSCSAVSVSCVLSSGPIIVPSVIRVMRPPATHSLPLGWGGTLS